MAHRQFTAQGIRDYFQSDFLTMIRDVIQLLFNT